MKKFRISVGSDHFDISLGEGTVSVQEQQLPYSLTRLGQGSYHLLLDGRSVRLLASDLTGGKRLLQLGRKRVTADVKDEQDLLLEQFGLAREESDQATVTVAPMPGLVLRILVEPGDVVDDGSPLIVLEAMKMENELRAGGPGTVKVVHVGQGEPVAKDQKLISFE